MRRPSHRVRTLLVLVLAVVLLAPTAIATGEVSPAGLAGAATDPIAAVVGDGGGVARAGAARLDANWHVGASAGQYASDGTFIGAHGVDPYQHSTRRAPSYGIESDTSVRALVVEGADGGRVAIVHNDLYIPQDMLHRRVGQLLEGSGTGIDTSNLTITVSHSHSSPYYSTTSWGVWAFQDVFDIRFFEFMARRMADAVIEAAGDMRPVRMGAAVSRFDATKRHSFGPAVADDGTPAGYPDNDTDARMSVVRFDDVSDPAAPSPLATWVVFGLHPEMLDGNDLHSGEWVNAMMTMIDRETGGVAIFSQSDTGTAEPARDARAHAPEARAEFSHAEYAQKMRAASLAAGVALDTWRDIEAGTPERPGEHVPFTTDFPVAVADIRFAPPSLRVAPAVSSCRAEKTFDGNPGVPIAGLPDCVYPVQEIGADGTLPFDPGVTYDSLRAAGVPVPDNVGAPSLAALQETAQVHLQAIRMGGIGITVCPCEQWADQSRNIRSRLNKVAGDFWEGFDWTEQRTPAGRDWCVQNPDTTWTCAHPGNPAVDLPPVSDEAILRM